MYEIISRLEMEMCVEYCTERKNVCCEAIAMSERDTDAKRLKKKSAFNRLNYEYMMGV